MKFIYVGAFRLPNLDAAAPRVLTIGKMLRDCGHSVRYISWGGKYDDTEMLDGKHYVDGFEYEISNELVIFKNPISRLKQWVTRGRHSLRMIASIEDYDAIIAYQPSLYFLEKVKSLCKSKGKRLIVDITEWYDNKELRLIDRPLQYYNMTTAIKSVKNKILISSHLADYYAGSNNVVIPATCDLTDNKWSKEPQKKFPSFDGITLIYAGTPVLKDKLYVIINVVSRLINEGYHLRFYIFGVTKDQYQPSHTQELSQLIMFMGTIPQDDIPGYYSQSDFMILIRDKSRKNMMGFPTKFSEAITSGIPIIANETSDISLYLKNGYNGFLLNDSTEDCLYNTLRERILMLSKDDIKRIKKISYNCRNQLNYTYFIPRINSFITNLK